MAMNSIPLSTGLFYGRSKTQMAGLTAQAERLQTDIATTKRLSAPSDDSVAYQRLQRIARQGADAGAYGQNLDVAASVLEQTDTALGAIDTQMQRAAELVIAARNGTQTPASRKAIGVELATIVDTLVQLANTNDSRGQPLFGGADGGAAVTRAADGAITFAAGAPPAIPVADDVAIQPGEAASRVFDIGGGRDALSMLAELAAALETGEALSDEDGAAAIDDLASANAQIAAARGAAGARAARIDLLQAQAAEVAADREAERSGLEDTDIATAFADLQQTLTVLQATQASFGKLSQLSLFDYLR
jgi:flagellar hook-associated protein 3 FlgL